MLGKFFPRDTFRAMSVGINLVVSTCVGLAIGYFLDKYLNTRPWLTLIFMFLGIISGFRELYRLARRQSNGADSNGPDTDKKDN